MIFIAASSDIKIRKNVIKVLLGLIGVVLGISSCGLPDPEFRVVPSDVSLSSIPKPTAAVGQGAIRDRLFIE